MNRFFIRFVALLLVPCLTGDPAHTSTFLLKSFISEAGNIETTIDEQAVAPHLVEAFREPFDALAAELARTQPHLQTAESFQPVTDKLVRFADYALQLPDYMVPLLDVRLWRDEGVIGPMP